MIKIKNQNRGSGGLKLILALEHTLFPWGPSQNSEDKIPEKSS